MALPKALSIEFDKSSKTIKLALFDRPAPNSDGTPLELNLNYKYGKGSPLTASNLVCCC